jgi:phosphate-selective porin OprO/OprP
VLGNFRAGHFYEPFSLENWGTSDNWITFIERASVVDALDPERNMGMILHNTLLDDRVFWAAGLFRPNSAEGNGFADDSGDGEYSYTARLTFNPIYELEGRCWLHFGGAYTYRSTIPLASGTIDNPAGDDPRFRSRIPVRARGTTFVNSERVIDTGVLLADSIQIYNVQAAMALGSFSLQGEAMLAQVHDLVRGPERREPAFWGCYAFASYFLTGEHRPYLRKIGGIGMPVPHEPFFFVDGDEGHGRPCFGRGAWELLARYGFLDLGSPAINTMGAIPPNSAFQGHLHDITLGLNWYLNPNFRIMWNYVYAHIDGLDVSPTTRSGDVHAFGMRFSFFF